MIPCELSEKLCSALFECMVISIKTQISSNDWRYASYKYVNIAKIICFIQALYNIIINNPCSFFVLKATLLKGLIINRCRDLSSLEKKEQLNKMIVIYAEHVKGLEPFEEISMIIDDEFFGCISSVLNNPNMQGEFYWEGIWEEVYWFVQRKFQQRNRKICKYGRVTFPTF